MHLVPKFDQERWEPAPQGQSLFANSTNAGAASRLRDIDAGCELPDRHII
jgi:hypothetical protein